MVITQGFFSLLGKAKNLPSCFTLIVLLLLTFLPINANATGVTAALDKKVSIENEVVQLTLRADFTNTGNGPDLTPLERDFDILGKSQNSQFSFNLGTSKALSFWVISLMPKSVGTFEIPPIKIGDYESQPLTLTIKNSPQLLDTNGNPPILITTEVSEIDPYLQQQVILKVKLYVSLQLQNMNRSTPTHPDLLIERLTDDQMSYEIVDNSEYQVITREYLIFPQRSGRLVIPPQTLQAMINTSSGRRLIKVQSEPLALQVLPIPASYPSNTWLPSKKVTVSTSLSSSSQSPRVGDTLIWTINISADGALPEQIPPMDFNSTPGYKLYPTPSEFSSRKNTQGITGSQSISVEVVPTAKGTLTLPDINVPYWDTETRSFKMAIAKTKAMEIAALPEGSKETNKTNTDSAVKQPLPPQSRSVAPISLAKKQPKAAEQEEGIKELNVELTESEKTFSFRDYMIYGLVIITLLSGVAWTLMRLKYQKKPFHQEEHQVPTLQEFAPLDTPDESSAYKSLIECCRKNDLSELRSHLLEWARHRWGDSEIQSIDDIKRLSESIQLTQLLMEAELMMYSKNPTHQWLGQPLVEALDELTSGQEKPSKESQLKTLYPNF